MPTVRLSEYCGRVFENRYEDSRVRFAASILRTLAPSGIMVTEDDDSDTTPLAAGFLKTVTAIVKRVLAGTLDDSEGLGKIGCLFKTFKDADLDGDISDEVSAALGGAEGRRRDGPSTGARWFLESISEPVHERVLDACNRQLQIMSLVCLVLDGSLDADKGLAKIAEIIKSADIDDENATTDIDSVFGGDAESRRNDGNRRFLEAISEPVGGRPTPGSRRFLEAISEPVDERPSPSQSKAFLRRVTDEPSSRGAKAFLEAITS